MTEDHLAIQRLTSDFCWCADTRDVDGIVALFAADGVFDAEPAGLGVFEGHEALSGFFGSLLPAHEYSQHIIGNHRIDLDGDTATGTSYYLMQGAIKGTGRISAAGYYEDRYVRTSDGWRLQSRRGVPLVPFNIDAMTENLAGA